MVKLVEGMKVRYLPQAEWGVGHLVAVDAEGKAEILFPARAGGPVTVSTKGGTVVPHQLTVGDSIRDAKGRAGFITGEEPGGRGLRRYTLKYEDGTEDELPESEVRATAPRPDLISTLREGRVGDARSFLLRRQALVLDDERRCDALGALFASRVMVKPHQVGVVQRVLSARRPRFVLADEVGLGKTIEAGMIFSALRLAGLARRVLVVSPSHLTVQWLAELFHKFNQLFTLMDGDRYVSSMKERPEISPWARFDKVVTSLELLAGSEEDRKETGDPAAYWDLVIIDEAHHLKGEKAYEAAQALANNSWGLLLLTATPMQLDPAEYHDLLTLIDPGTAPTLEGFESRLARQEELSEAVRALLEGGNAAATAKKLSARFPGDETLKRLKDRDAVLEHLAETYSLSDHLIRNRRAVVGGFAARKLVRHPVQPSAKELEARATAVDALAGAQLKGAALSGILRRMESSAAAFHAAVLGSKALAPRLMDLTLPARDSKYEAFLKVLKGIWAQEPGAKVLVFTESRDTLELLQKELGRDAIVALGYHGELALLERDRQVARFRDPEGPKVLICTEVGGEGRNFQFAHHLVNYDLPWSPSTMEQRIGRLDRIGQLHPVQIHVFDSQGTLSAEVLAILADAVGVFGETVGGLDAVLEEVEPRLTELALLSPEERRAYRETLAARVQEARASVQRAYDPLLDLRSFDRGAVAELVRRAKIRMGMEEEPEEDAEEEEADGEDAETIDDGLQAISRDLDERLEESVTELAARVGLGVDTEEQVDAFQCAFHFGHALNVEALPGIDIQEEKTVLGTFWRDTAVDQEEIEYFATGHPIVESLFGFLRDGPYGRNGVRFIERRGPLKAKGLELLFHLVPPEAEDTSPGAKVPSRQLSRFLDQQLLRVAVALGPNAVPRVDGSLLPALETEGKSLKGDEIRVAFPDLTDFVEPAVAAGTAEAERQMREVARKARTRIEAERDTVLRRMKLSLTHQGLDPQVIDAQLHAEQTHYAALLRSLEALKVNLDAACGFVINR